MINKTDTDKSVKILQKFPDLLISRGGQVIKTLEEIEKPKNKLRKEFNEQLDQPTLMCA